MADIFVAPKHRSHMNVLSSFSQNPKNVSFQTQKEKEQIVLFLRSHFTINFPWITFSILLIFLPLIISAILPLFKIDFLSSPIAIRFTTIYVLLYYLLVFSYAFVSFLHWFYNVFIVSTERIIDIDYSDVVIHNMAITSLSHVEDVNYTQSGFIPTVINYGDLFVQTAGDERNFEAPNIPKPREAASIIGDLTGKRHFK